MQTVYIVSGPAGIGKSKVKLTFSPSLNSIKNIISNYEVDSYEL